MPVSKAVSPFHIKEAQPCVFVRRNCSRCVQRKRRSHLGVKTIGYDGHDGAVVRHDATAPPSAVCRALSYNRWRECAASIRLTKGLFEVRRRVSRQSGGCRCDSAVREQHELNRRTTCPAQSVLLGTRRLRLELILLTMRYTIGVPMALKCGTSRNFAVKTSDSFEILAV